MELVEIRDLDGPNLFQLRPVIKVELVTSPGERVADAPLENARLQLGVDLPAGVIEATSAVISRLHELAGLPVPEVAARSLDQPDHHALSFPWEWRSTAIAISDLAVQVLRDEAAVVDIGAIQGLLERDRAEGDRPAWVRDSERRIPCAGITGTNGKTTTTRLTAHIARNTGKSTGWSSSSGVYINGEQVLEGDYTGPGGARRVLEDPSVEIGVLETARGGILLRGIAYESNDVGLFLNVSADHLSMHGVETLETLAEVKATVVRVTKPDGVAVLNADDPYVLAQRERISAELFLFSQRPDSPAIVEHLEAGGRAMLRQDDQLLLAHGQHRQLVAPLSDVPMTFGGIARHMVENALAAGSVAIGLGFTAQQVGAGLSSFRSDIRSNTGRLNVFRLHGRVIIVDYAHNESGLEALMAFSRGLMGGTGKLYAIVGTAGDRPDDVLQSLGRIAGENADRVLIKETTNYLRGRDAGEIVSALRAGIREAGATSRLAGVFPDEHAALVEALDQAGPGDAIAVMCVQDQLAVFRELRDRGAEEWR